MRSWNFGCKSSTSSLKHGGFSRKKCRFSTSFTIFVLITTATTYVVVMSIDTLRNQTSDVDSIPNESHLMMHSSCLSKHDALLHQYGKPSYYLMYKLQSYEARHKRCGPYTDSYKKAISVLEYDYASQFSSRDCRYIIYETSKGGLGNTMIGLISTFLYALLTDRVLLVNRDASVTDLLCEPFPETSWLLPTNFPEIADSVVKRSKFENLVWGNEKKSVGQYSYLSIGVNHNSSDRENMFFCDEEQSLLKNISWIVMQSNQYFVPSIFSIPRFRRKLDLLFPDRELVFHLLSRYLYHPNDHVWGLVRRFYDSYLSKADVIVGIQLRLFDHAISLKNIVDQVISCTVNEGILPKIIQRQQRDQKQQTTKYDNDTTTIAVLITSLDQTLYEEIKRLFWRNPTLTGQTVAVYQPSYEGIQHTGETDHDATALAEIYLLSLSDKLITSSYSTFGYAAQGIGGLRPWMLNNLKQENYPVPDPLCWRATTMEPCHLYPPTLNCGKMKERSMVVDFVWPHAMECEDFKGGIKLVSSNSSSIP